MKSYKIAAALVAIGGLVTSTWLIGSNSLKDFLGLQGAESAPCFYSDEGKFSYELSYTLTTSTDSSRSGADALTRMAAKQQVRLAGLLSFHPLSEWTASVAFTPREYRIQGYEVTDAQREFNEPVELSLDKHCQISEIAFDGRQPFRSRELLRSFLGLSVLDQRALSLVQLETTEDDIQGQIAVSYTRESDVVTKIRKEVTIPSKSRENRNLSATFLESGGKFQLSKTSKAPRFEGLTAKEITRITSRDTPDTAIQAVQMTMRLVSSIDVASGPRIPDSRKVVKKPTEAFAGKDPTSAYSNTEMRHMPVNGSLSDAIDEFELLMKSGDVVGAKKKIGAYLLKNPEALAKLNDRMANSDFTDEESMHLLFLLARLDHPRAQEVITSLIRNDDAPAHLRIQSIIASSDILKPADETKRLLKDLAEQVNSADLSDSFDMKQRVFNTAINSYGTMANRLREIDPIFEDDAVQSFKNLISENAAAPDILQAVLGGAGNFAHEDLLEAISAHLSEGNPEVRSSAAGALARIDNDRAEDLIVGKLQVEAHDGVRQDMTQGLASRASTVTPYNLPAIATVLQHEPVAKTRSLLVDVLGRASTQPEAKKALIEAAARETESSVVQEIGRYVTAAELSGSVSRRARR